MSSKLNEIGAPFPLASFGFLRAYLVTMRPYLLFVSGAAGLTGLAFVRGLDLSQLGLAFVPFFLSYGLGQALTDCFQTDTDALSAPYRPLVRGEVTRPQVLGVSLFGLVLCALVFGYLNVVILVPAVLAVLGLVTYTWFKRRPWGGPPWNAAIVALLPIMGRMVDGRFSAADCMRLRGPDAAAFALAVGVIFCGYANFVVTGYFKDISADARTGYRTLPVVAGWLRAALVSDALAAATAVLCLACLHQMDETRWPAFAVWAVAAAISVLAQIRIHRTREEACSHGPIAGTVRVFLLYCLAIVVQQVPSWLPWLACYYFLFEWALRVRPERSQV
jgi:4-hydroxybenzoate polyprenyltransferase